MTLELLQEMLPPPLYETELPEGEAMPLFQKVISLPRIHGLKRGEAPPPGGLIFLLREGLLRIASRRDVTHQVTKYFVKSPQLFGELALMAREKEYDIAEALSHCCISVYHAPTVKEHMIAQNDLSQYIWNLLAGRFNLIREQMHSFTETNLEERILAFLSNYIRQVAREEQHSSHADNFLSYFDIAFHTNASLPEVKNTLEQLEKKGEITYSDKKIILHHV